MMRTDYKASLLFAGIAGALLLSGLIYYLSVQALCALAQAHWQQFYFKSTADPGVAGRLRRGEPCD